MVLHFFMDSHESRVTQGTVDGQCRTNQDRHPGRKDSGNSPPSMGPRDKSDYYFGVSGTRGVLQDALLTRVKTTHWIQEIESDQLYLEPRSLVTTEIYTKRVETSDHSATWHLDLTPSPRSTLYQKFLSVTALLSWDSTSTSIPLCTTVYLQITHSTTNYGHKGSFTVHDRSGVVLGYTPFPSIIRIKYWLLRNRGCLFYWTGSSMYFWLPL